MGPVKLHEWRAFLGLAPHSTNITACAHDHYNHCSSISSLILEDNNLTLTLVRAQSVRSPCTVRAQSVHSPCTVRAQSVHSPCTQVQYTKRVSAGKIGNSIDNMIRTVLFILSS